MAAEVIRGEEVSPLNSWFNKSSDFPVTAIRGLDESVVYTGCLGICNRAFKTHLPNPLIWSDIKMCVLSHIT